MHTSLQGIAEKAKSQATYRVRNRDGRLTEERRKECWRDIRTDAAYGVDAVSAQAYEPDWDGNISHLVERLKRKRYRATRVRRPSRLKENGQRRPLGIPAVEDTRLQLAVTRLLTAIDAQEFLRWSDGYRPHIGALDAGDTLTITRPCGRDNWVVEADIRGVFDHAC